MSRGRRSRIVGGRCVGRIRPDRPHPRTCRDARDDVVLGIGDDAALLRVPPGKLLVVATDTLNAGVHFPDDTAPADIGWKALAVNLSDLAAMGAQPAWCTLSLSLPAGRRGVGRRASSMASSRWRDAARRRAGRRRHDARAAVDLRDRAWLRRRRRARCAAMRARVGDDIWVSGTLGDAAARWRSGAPARRSIRALRERLDRPTPRVALGRALVGIAHAASMCPTGCSPIWPRVRRERRRRGDRRRCVAGIGRVACGVRRRCASRSCRPPAATITSCASPRPRRRAMRSRRSARCAASR